MSMAGFDPNEEVTLHSSRKEKEDIEEMADLYGIIKATDMLEAAYTRGHIGAEEYTSACASLISSFELQEQTLRSKGLLVGPNAVKDFLRANGLSAHRAEIRLLQDKVPATSKHVTASSSSNTAAVISTTECYITALDAIRLRLLAKDQLFPVIKDLASALQQQSNLPADHESKVKVMEWLAKLAAMNASDTLSETQEREIMFDLDQAYHAFRGSFSGSS